MSASTPMTPAARIGLTTLLAVYGVMIIRNPDHFRLIDNVDLAIHEAGHVFFGFLGEFIGFLGGTLLQLIVPAAFVVYFLRRADRYAASIVLWWFAQNLWNISIYVRDARSQLLPLVGGGEHDWAYLLGRLGWLEHDQGLGRAVFAIGVLLFLVSFYGGVVSARGKAAA